MWWWLTISHAAFAGTCDDALVRRQLQAAFDAPCATLGLMAFRQHAPEGSCEASALRERGLSPAPSAPAGGGPGAGKQSRDPYGVPNSLPSDNFVVRWGNSGGVNQSDAEDVVRWFEDSWAHEMGVMGFPGPDTSDSHKFNVYIGDTGSGAPSSYGAGGYFSYDSQGWPMIVLAANSLGDPGYAESASAHEFFHAVQAGIATYVYEGQGAWYWEATASWAAGEVFPDNAYYAAFLFGLAYLPELPINAFDYPDTGAVEEYHQYGAFLFPRYVSELHGGTDVIKRSWLEAPSSGDPLAVLEDLLAEQGVAIDDAYFDFADRNATFDYADGETYAAWIETYGGWGADWSRRPTSEIASVTDGPVSPPSFAPYTYGANYWLLNAPLPTMQIAFTGDSGPDRWHVSLATRRGEVHERHPISLDGDAGAAVIEGVDGVDEAWIVVAVADGFYQGSSHGYTLEVSAADSPPQDTGDTEAPQDTGAPPDSDPDTQPPSVDTGADTAAVTLGKAGCGCASSPGAPGALAAIALGLVALRRRREP